MELYNVPRGSFVLLENQKQNMDELKLDLEVDAPPGTISLKEGQILYFDHIDGMYSFCIDAEGNVVHPAAWTLVEVLEETNEIKKMFSKVNLVKHP